MTSPSDPFEAASSAADRLHDALGEHRVAVVLGSGWAGVAEALGETLAELPASELPGVAVPTVPGHEGVLRSVGVPLPSGAPVRVLVMSGRAHLYEGHGAADVVHPVRAAVLAGARTMVLTNAAGSLRPEWAPGSTVLISDQLNLTGANPMCGAAPPGGSGARFVDLSDLYGRRLRSLVRARRPELAEGVYAGVLGGSFETPAEIRMLRGMGADLVGMSTVLESIAAHHLGAEVVGLSLVTNLAAGLQPSVDHAEVLAVGDAAEGSVSALLRTIVEVTQE